MNFSANWNDLQTRSEYYLIEPITAEEKKSSIYIPGDKAREKEGIIVAGQEEKEVFIRGSRVLYGTLDSLDFEIDGKKYDLVPVKNVCILLELPKEASAHADSTLL